MLTVAVTVAELLAERGRQHPEQVGFRFLTDAESRAETLTYAQLDMQARRIAALLEPHAGTGDRALLLHAPGLDYIASLFGCLYAGVVAVPAMPPASGRPVTSLVDLLADTGAKVVLASNAIANRVQPRLAAAGVHDLRWLPPPGQGDGDAPRSSRETPQPEQLAVLQYTSGSTTTPKGVMLSHGTLLSNVRMLAEQLGATPTDRLVGWLPPYHDMGLIGAILAPVYASVEATLFAPAAFLQRPLRWLEAIARYGATISGGPNFAYDLCVRRSTAAEREKLDLSRWRVAFSGAERVRAETLERFSEAFAPAGFRRSAFCPCYGLAEATLGVSFGRIGAGPRVSEIVDGEQPQGAGEPATRSMVSTGPPLPGLEVLIVNPDTGHPLPEGTKGEIWVRGPSVALGYWNKPELTGSVFHAKLAGGGAAAPGYLRTGDLGLSKDGEIYVTGRLKDLIILFGVNHHPEDIEATLDDCHPSVRAASSVAFSIEGPAGEELAVVVEVDSTPDVPVEDIQRAVRGAVASERELRADRVLIVGPGCIPRTSSGKVRRAACRKLYLDGELALIAESTQSKDTLPPVSEDPKLTATITTLMAELLSVERVEPDADFFALGGHSLLATQLVARVREALAIELPLRLLFESPTAQALSSKLRSLPSEMLPPVSRRGGDQPKLLSFSQERMWFLQQVDPEGTAYNVAGGVVLEGQLDVAALELGLRALLERHEILRTNYLSQSGRPEIVVAASRPFSFVRRDLSALPEPERQAERLASALASRPFDLARDLLIRVELYQLGAERHALAASLHHVVGDGWSMGILLAELLRAYARARTPSLAEPDAHQATATSYLDYAAWQRRELVPRRFSDELRYWRKQLAGAPLLELPSDRPRSTRRSSAGALHTLDLPDELMERLGAVGRAHGATLFMVMLAAFEALLHRWTGSADIVVGTPVANRTHLAAEKLVGTLVNTVAMRVRFDPDQPFAALLSATRQSALDAWAHQELPFERLVSELGVPRIPGRSPLFEVMFDFQNSPMPVDAAGELRLRPLKLERGAAQFELSLLVLNTELGRLAGIEYSTALFDAETIRRFGAQYLQVLSSIAGDVEQPVSRLRLHTPAEEAALVALATRASGAPLVHPVRAFASWAQRKPNAVAVSDGTTTFTYSQLAHRVDELAARLRDAGAKPGERIALFLSRSSHVPLALLAVLKTGAAYVPVDPGHPDARIGHVLHDAEPLAVLTEAALRERAAGLNVGPCLLVDADGAETNTTFAPPADDSLAAYILYTSGSTGRPKGVEVSVGSLANFFASMAREPGMTERDRLLSVTTIAFDIASLELLLPLTVGAEIYVAGAAVVADGQALRALLEQEAFTLLQATPSAYRLLLAAGFKGARQLTALVGGEPLDRQLAEQLLERVPRLWNMYGPTETTVWSTLRQVQPADDPVPIGVPIDRTSVYVLDRHLALAPLGVPGEICIGGAGVARGYWRQPALTAEKFVPDPFAGERFGESPRLYRTGDRGRLRADGLLECLGRVDQQVKIRGHRVELGEIEAVLRQAPGVRDCVAACRELRPGDVRLAAYYTTSAPGPLEVGELRKLMRQALPDYMVPTDFVRLDAIPLTPNGKVNRAALPQPPEGAGKSEREHVPPRSPDEALLAELWGEALGIAQPSVVDDFFALGGHSLLAVRLLAAIERRTGISLPLAVLLEQPTIEQLARRLAEGARRATTKVAHVLGTARGGREFSFVVPIQAQGDKPPLFCVHGAGGNVLNLYALGQKLGQSRPFFGIQAAGVDGVSTPKAHVEEMAEAYLAELVKVQAHGPYFLSGYCGGGIVAFEMAQRLLAAGQEVALLALMDAFRPGLPVFVTPVAARLRALQRQGPGYLWQGGKRRFLRNWRAFWTAALIRYYLLFRGSVPHALREFWLMTCFLRGARHYAPQPYPRKLTVLRAKDSALPERVVGRDLGWGAVSTGGLELYEVPGDHDTLAHEPNVSTLAETLNHCVALAEAELAHARRDHATPG